MLHNSLSITRIKTCEFPMGRLMQGRFMLVHVTLFSITLKWQIESCNTQELKGNRCQHNPLWWKCKKPEEHEDLGRLFHDIVFKDILGSIHLWYFHSRRFMSHFTLEIITLFALFMPLWGTRTIWKKILLHSSWEISGNVVLVWKPPAWWLELQWKAAARSTSRWFDVV